MLSKKQRIGRKEFMEIISRGRRYNSTHLTLYLLKEANAGNSVFSFSASKKVSKKATSRNTLRRRGYSVINKILKKIKPGYKCFFLFKNNSSNPNFSILEIEILELLKSGGVLS